jgi:hypothetical protein
MNRRFVGLLSCAFVTSVVTACGGGTPAPVTDAGADAGFVIAPPLPPALTPCAEGWREVTDAAGLVTCDPFPETGYRTDCAWDQAHFAGTPGCARVGTACPADGWPADLPTDRAIVYVDDGAVPGGDGASRASAFATIGAAIAAAPSGAVIAVATGLYDGSVNVGAGMTLWGACVAGTRVLETTPSPSVAVLTFVGDDGGVRNLGVDAPETSGIEATGVSGISIDAIVVTGARRVGLFLSGGSMSVREVVVRDTRGADPSGLFGRGINVNGGARVLLSRALIDGNRNGGLVVMGAGTTVEASDLVARGTREQAVDGLFGRGLDVEGGAHLVLSRALIDDNRDVGLMVMGTLTSVEASDVVVRGTRDAAPDGPSGTGIGVQEGAHLALTRALVEDNRCIGADVVGAGTSAEWSDVVVRGTRERASDGLMGRGIGTQEGAHVTLTRALVDDNRDIGVFVARVGTILEARDLVVRDTMPRSSDAASGTGLWAQNGASVVLAGARIERSYSNGIGSAVGATVEARDFVVSGVAPTRCAPRTCTGDTGGFGLVAIFGGKIVASRFMVEDATLCGVLVGRDDLVPTGVDLESGVIDRAAVGACVQQDGYDTTRLQDGVEYREVGVPLRATSYELPSSI